jgi:hypothetical protein
MIIAKALETSFSVVNCPTDILKEQSVSIVDRPIAFKT